jgi:hypothetical protein
MSMTMRVILALGILAIDLVIFFIPVSALFLIYVILFNPPWVRAFLNRLDGNEAA